MIEERLAPPAGGPYHLGARFSLLDMALAYWVMMITLFGGFEGSLAGCPSVLGCVRLVRARPKLKARFDAMEAERDPAIVEYLRKQQSRG